jgi:hypothetical protein
MPQCDIALPAGRFKDREACFHGRKAPFAIMQGRAAMEDGFAQLVQDFLARNFRRSERLEAPLDIAADLDAVGQRPQIGALTGRDQDPELLMPRRARVA